MFSNIGPKLKAVAIILFVVEVIAVLGSGLSFMEFSAVIGVLILLVGFLTSWISAMVLYGLGEMMEESSYNSAAIANIKKELKELRDEINKKENVKKEDIKEEKNIQKESVAPITKKIIEPAAVKTYSPQAVHNFNKKILMHRSIAATAVETVRMTVSVRHAEAV